tara:strand:+ start:8190 stop:8849 length:660 start_codon:yes stop_codon:yes gene_type:complete
MPKTYYFPSRKLHWLTFAIIVLGSFQLAEELMSGSGLGSVFRYERDLILRGEYYRLITAHFVHLNWTHFAMNALGVAACCLLLDGTPKGLSFVLISGVTVISAGLLLLYPQVQWYVGYSGVLYGQVFYALLVGILQEIRRARLQRDPAGLLRLLLLVLGAVYLLYLVIAANWPIPGSLQGSDLSEGLIGAPVLHEAHLLGTLAGLFGFGLLCLRKSTQT